MGYSKQIIKELPLNGKLITGEDSATIGNNFQTLKNMRYADNNPKGILGMTKINTTELTTNLKIRNGFHFQKAQPAESHVLVQAFNTGLTDWHMRENTTSIPSQGNFSSTDVYDPSSGLTTVGQFSKAPNGQVAFCNGANTLIWSGNEIPMARFINYDASDETHKYDYTDILKNTNTTEVATLISTATECSIYIGTTRQIKGIKFYVSVANTATASIASVSYWNAAGSWISISGLTDNTSVGGKTLAQTGTVTFNTTVGNQALPKVIDGMLLYWYKVVTSAALSATTALYYVTVDQPMQGVRDLWDGEARSCLSCQIFKSSTFNDYTVNVHDDSYDSANTATYIELDALATGTDYIVVGFPEQITGLMIHLIGGHVNTTAATTVTVKYWNGSVWTAFASSTDGTVTGAISFAKSGVIQWNSPTKAVEFKREIGKEVPLYYYQISFDKNLSADVQLYYVGGITTSLSNPVATASTAPGYLGGFKFPVFSKDRLWLCCDNDGKKNMAWCSMKDAPDVWNGEDSKKFYFGDDSALTCGCSLYSRLGSSIYNVTLFYKANEMYGVTGNSPQDFVQYNISETIGCPAPLTLKTTFLHAESGSRPIAIWQGSNGVYLFDNNSPIPIHGDIKDKFDKNSSTKINASKIGDSVGFIDEENMEYHLLIATGSSTTLNEEWAYDLRRNRWYQIDRSSYLQFGMEVKDTSGNTYCYGAIDTGYLERLEYGTTFDGNNIVCTVKMGDIAPYEGSIMYESQLIKHKLVIKAKNTTANDVSITHYGDSATNGTSLTSANPANTSGRLADAIDTVNLGNHIFHSLEYSMTTSDETIGFEPLFIGLKFNILGEDLS